MESQPPLSKTSTVFLLTIMNPTDDDRQRLTQLPLWVDYIKTQDEVCPTTGTPHFHVCVKTKYTQDGYHCKSWLPRCNVRYPGSEKHALNIMNYTDKEKSAVEGTRQTISNDVPHLSLEKACLLLAREALSYDWTKYTLQECSKWNREWNEKNEFKFALNKVLEKDTSRAGFFANPSLRSFWLLTRETWKKKVRDQD